MINKLGILGVTVGGAIVAAALMASPAQAANMVQWNFATNADGNGSLCGSGCGHTLEFTASGGETLRATAWSQPNGGTFVTSNLGQWSGGLGVWSDANGDPNNTPQHSVDNQGYDDFVLFELDRQIAINTATVTTWLGDGNYTVWVGNHGNGYNDPAWDLAASANPDEYADLTALGFSKFEISNNADFDNNGSADTTGPFTDSFNNGGSPVSGNVVFIAAKPNYSNSDPSGYNSYDGIKIKKLGGEYGNGGGNDIPEPATLALFTAGLAAVGFARRKVKRA
jgi:hypothetical protein